MADVERTLAEIEAGLKVQDGVGAGAGRVMPRAAYTDPDFLARERAQIFAHDWLCLGRADAMAEPGQYITYQIADQPVFAMRQADGSIRAFSNVCLHRMMLLLPDGAEAGQCGKRFSCPYHGWTYERDGRLVGTPQIKGLDKSAMRLPEIACTQWAGFVFVSLADTPPDLHARLEPLTQAIAPYRPEGYVQAVTQDHVWQTNWKLLAENFMESYHLPVAHRRTVGAWCPVEGVRFPHPPHPAYTCQTFPKDPAATYGLAPPENQHLTGDLRHTSIMPTVFPATMFVLAPDHLWWLSLMPRAVDSVHVRFGAAIAPERLRALPDVETYLRETIAFFDQVNDEDRCLVESIHRGTRAPLSKPGPLSWLERGLSDFQSYILERLG
jgi:phenylpropionate dioxygenase-like ring-hydroxylating dioxygenase large terminal subunit